MSEVVGIRTTDKINLALAICSFILAVISIVTVILTIRQNNKMIEGSTRPILSFYTDGINTGNPTFWFVVRNFGQSVAQITKISSSVDFKKFLIGVSQVQPGSFDKYDPMETLKDAVIAPGQSRICALDYDKCPELIGISVTYTSPSGKEYKENFTLNTKAGNRMTTAKTAGGKCDTTLSDISYTLQEMLQKKL